MLTRKPEMIPPTPRSRPKELPDDHNAATVDIMFGRHEIYPSPLLFEPMAEIGRNIDHSLKYRHSPRAVVTPVATTSKNDLYPRGLATTIKEDNHSLNLTFPEADHPATNPPVSAMNISTPGPWRSITIPPRPHGGFVACGDVQREVVRWIREIADQEEEDDGRMPWSKTETIYIPDGTEVQVELWQWRGLKRRGRENDTWEMFL
jgi:hypothetical protein